MILPDSSAWVHFFVGGKQADQVSQYLLSFEKILVPTLVLHEVGRYFLKRMYEVDVLAVLAQLRRGKIIPLSTEIAWKACVQGKKWKLATADSIIYATALSEKAKVLTFDNDFRGLPNVEVLT